MRRLGAWQRPSRLAASPADGSVLAGRCRDVGGHAIRPGGLRPFSRFKLSAWLSPLAAARHAVRRASRLRPAFAAAPLCLPLLACLVSGAMAQSGPTVTVSAVKTEIDPGQEFGYRIGVDGAVTNRAGQLHVKYVFACSGGHEEYGAVVVSGPGTRSFRDEDKVWRECTLTLQENESRLSGGYTLGDPSSATVRVKGAAPPPTPVVSVSGGGAVTEGGMATFTLTASPAPRADIQVQVTVGQTGDFVAGGETGSRTVTVGTDGTAGFAVGTDDDGTHEENGAVTATVGAGDGYSPHGSDASASVVVNDNDNAAPEVASPIPDQTATAGTAFSHRFPENTFRDPDGDTLSYAAELAGDSWLSFTEGSRTFSGTPGAGDVGTLTVRVTADDGNGGTVHDDFDIMVGTATMPVVRVSGGGAVSEGGTARFTLTATPPPTGSVTVNVDVAESGSFAAGGQTGPRAVTIGTGGTVTLNVATVDDTADEPDGEISATVRDGSGYAPHGTEASASVPVGDDDPGGGGGGNGNGGGGNPDGDAPRRSTARPATVSVSGGGTVSEGAAATFTVSADPAPATALEVRLDLAEAGQFLAAPGEGERVVTVAAGATAATLRVATVDDMIAEADGILTATVAAGEGYVPGGPSSARVEVLDDDLPEAAFALASQRAGESSGTVDVRVTLDPVPAEALSLLYRVGGTATPGADHSVADAGPSGVLRVDAGAASATVRVALHDDGEAEGNETVVLSLAPGAGYAVGGVREHVLTIVDDDLASAATEDEARPAFLARFGRTVAQQALDGIAGRIDAPRVPGLEAALAGHALGAGDAEAAMTPSERKAAEAERRAEEAMAELARAIVAEADPKDPFGDGAAAEPRAVDGTDALLGTAFTLTTARDGAGGTTAFWGRAARSGFDGAERGDGTDVLLDGTVTTAMLGADHARGRWLAGLALARSSATGGYRDGGGDGGGEVEATLSSVVPYGAFRASERLSLWAALGRGTGEVTLATAMEEDLSADTEWSMAAAGLRGGLLGGHGSGPALAVVSDALRTRTASEEVPGLAASGSATSRLRLALEGSWTLPLEGGGGLTPRLEIGLRHDGGDAETGLGIEAGGGVAWSDPARGISLDVSGRTLVAHGNDDLEDWGVSASVSWDPFPETRRGPAISMRQAYGGSATGGLDALLSPDPLDPARAGGVEGARTAFEAAYGLPAFGGRFTGTPHAGCGVSGDVRDCTVGWRLSPEARGAPDLSFGARATRRESGANAPQGVLGIDLVTRW